MSLYFESQLNASIDVFIWLIPVYFILILVLMFPAISAVAGQLFKTKPRNLVRVLLVLTVFNTIGTYMVFSRHQSIQIAIENNALKVVEGCIQEYQLKMSAKGTRIESFTVDSVFFELNKYDQGPFFYNQHFADNIIKDGQCVKLSYLIKNGQNKIVKIMLLTKKSR